MSLINSQGNTIWSRLIGDSTSEYAHHIIQTDDGGYVIVGEVRADTTIFGSWINPNVLVIKTNSNGVLLWRKIYGVDDVDEVGWKVSQGGDSEIMILAVSGEDSWLLYVTANGDTVWTRKYEGDFYSSSPMNQYHIRPDMIKTADGGWLIVNTTIGFNGDLLVIKTNSGGDIEWTNDGIVNQGLDVPVAAFQTSNNEYQIIGYSDTWYEKYGFMALISTSGQLLWLRTIYPTERNGRWYHAIKSSDTTYMIVGRARSAGLSVYNATDNGDMISEFVASDDINSFGNSCVKHVNGDYYVLGATRTFDPNDYDIWLLRFNIDNIAPGVPTGFFAVQAESGIIVAWNPSQDQDFQFYAIYRSIQDGFNPDTMETFFAAVEDTMFLDVNVQQDITYFYRVSAFDYAGNESEYSETVSGTFLEVHIGFGIPDQFALHQNYPNPFNPTSTIQYDLPEATNVTLVIYDILGREVVRLVDQEMQPGYHQAIWDARNHAGQAMPTGIYIARLVTLEYTQSIKMVLLK